MRMLGLVVALAGALGRVAGAAEPWTGPPVLVTSGEAILHVAPDRAFVQIAAEGRDPAAKKAQQAEAQAMTAVRRELAQAKIPDEAVRSVSYDLQLEFDYVSGKQVPRGYLARHVIEVRLDDVALLGDVIGRAVDSGAAGVASIRFDVKARDELERTALKQAVEDARARAEAAAAGVGATVGGVIRLDEQRMAAPRPMAMSRGMVAEAAVATPIAPGEIEIRAAVTLTSALK